MSKAWVIVDCEARDSGNLVGTMTEFGAVLYDKPPFETSFHAQKLDIASSLLATMLRFTEWIEQVAPQGATFWSDNVAFDWKHIDQAFHTTMGGNPFGFSARRIGDLYAGLTRRPHDHNSWKRWRKTPHDHNPVNDARGNAEALWHMLHDPKLSETIYTTHTGLV